MLKIVALLSTVTLLLAARPASDKSAGAVADPAPNIASSTSAVSGALTVTSDYRIGVGDTLQIMVWKEPEASVPSAIVRPDGKIAMPLLKEVEVAGRTPSELERVITERLSKLITGVDVTVIVSKFESKRAYLVGAVKKEGPLALNYPMTILQALSEAGGLTDYAKRKKIYVLRTEGGAEKKYPFNYDAVLRGQNIEQNIRVMPNDTIVVPN